MLHNMLRAAAGAGGDLFIDKFGTPTFAYSLRLLSSVYSGNCIRVRRSSDNAEQDIGFSGGALDESALTSFVGANDGRVTTWYDQSGNANNAVEATASYQPLIVVSGSVFKEGTLPAIRYAGASMDGMDTGIAGATQKTIVGVCNSSTGGGGGARRLMTSYAGSEGAGDTVLLDYFSGEWRFFDGGVNRSVSSAAQQSVVFAYRTSSSIGIAINGGTASTTSVGTSTSSNTMKLFEEGGNYLDETPQSISESILYLTDESASRSDMELDVNDYYGVY